MLLYAFVGQVAVFVKRIEKLKITQILNSFYIKI